MITWISSYPRSGNTVIRLMLKEVTRLRAAVSGVFFRSGSNDANQAEMPPAVRRVLASVCWREMNGLGYPASYAGAEDKQIVESLVDADGQGAACRRSIT